jgi:DNA gyrase subunit B
MIVEVRRNGKLYRQEYKRGLPTTKSDWWKISFKLSLSNGTAVSFLPDKEIFKETMK